MTRSVNPTPKPRMLPAPEVEVLYGRNGMPDGHSQAWTVYVRSGLNSIIVGYRATEVDADDLASAVAAPIGCRYGNDRSVPS